MMNISRFSAFALSLAVALTLSACGGGISSTPWSSPQQTPVTADSGPSSLERPADGMDIHVQQPGMETAQTTAQTAGQTQMPPQVPAATALPPVKVALLLPLSGQNAALGQSMMQAAQLALFDMNYTNFELMPHDTMDTAEGGRAAAQAAVQGGAQLILGPLFSANIQGAKPVAQGAGLNMVAFSTDWNQAGDNSFIMGFLPFGQVERIAQYAASRGYKRVGILAPENDYGNAVVSAYNAYTQRAGLPPAQVTRLPANTAAHDAVIRQFARYTEAAPGTAPAPAPYDAVLLPFGGAQLVAVANTLTYYNMGPDQVKRLGTGLWDDSNLTREASLRGGWFAAPQPDARRAFEKRYFQLYSEAPPRLASLAYDATALAAVMARTSYAQTGRVSFDRMSITNPNGFAGIDGIFRFRPEGIAERGLAVMEIGQGDMRVIDRAPATFQAAAGM